MKKFWRSGMIDKKVIEKRKQDDYMNKLHRTILESTREIELRRGPDMMDFMDLIDWYLNSRKP
ncbi:hypothetical protein PP198_gp25 [Streptococcus phage CHPC1036]|uniref:Uncharacterized protein n=1 Tax=Streptococcus phage CHPC1036 TaxID=2365012 RepID=A0A3G8FC23_9CAUD|nr:hypothetical protein PP198_gp25 [Streptococcus phage CHPC1036]AZF91390.1 hypothetical protein CHPC1036_0025 [Streptococcus phage CHPC1036]